MLLFLKFLWADILGNFVFQSENWIKNKEKYKIKSYKLYFHIAIHTLLLLVLIQFNLATYWLGFLLIIGTHYSFDILKRYLQNRKKNVFGFL